jgi:hypothetical protein
VVPYIAEPSDEITSNGGGNGASTTVPSSSFFQEQTLGPQVVDHAGDQRIDIGLALPQIEIDAERREIHFLCGHREIAVGRPHLAVRDVARLQARGGLARAIAERLVALRACGGLGIERL